MWKLFGYISTSLLACFSLSALAILAWYYAEFDFQNTSGYDDQFKAYINTIRAVLACDLFFFIVCFIGIFNLIRPTIGLSKLYCLLIVLLIVYKIVAGALFYSGVNDEGKQMNDSYQFIWDKCNQISCSPSDKFKSWHTARSYEIASIIIFAILGLFSAVGALKVSFLEY